jgi:predicted transcriptional regulator
LKKDQRRQYFNIIAGILESAADGALKTRIMYTVNLSYAQLGKYISLLIKLELLEEGTRGKLTVYKKTEKGTDFLKRYRELERLLGK